MEVSVSLKCFLVVADQLVELGFVDHNTATLLLSLLGAKMFKAGCDDWDFDLSRFYKEQPGGDIGIRNDLRRRLLNHRCHVAGKDTRNQCSLETRFPGVRYWQSFQL